VTSDKQGQKRWDILVRQAGWKARPPFKRAVKSADLKNWKNISDELVFPRDHRHGSALKISERLARTLIDRGIHDDLRVN
jgi:hypothetical protein